VESVTCAMNKTLLSPKEAAEFLGVPESTLAQWRSQRRGPPYIKLELRLVRYRQSDLETYLGQHLVETEVDKAHA
jgi:predicted DNA-binding transcriptional regulator AlpA